MLLILCVAFSLCLLVMLKYIYHDLAPGKIFFPLLDWPNFAINDRRI